MTIRPWQDIAKEQQALRDARIPKQWLLESPPDASVKNVYGIAYTCGLMTKRELELTDKDATELLELLSTGKLTSYELTVAFCKRASIAQQLINCLTHVLFDDAFARAQELDDYYQKTGTTVGPYHGLPISVKEQFNVKGVDSTAGYVSRVGSIAREDSTLVRLCRDAGAVIFCKTNNPQTLMHLESHSNEKLLRSLWPYLNGFNRDLTCGGSSGGEGALVGFHGSPLGLAADGGGSIRSPAANNGVYGLKSTPYRVASAGGNRPAAGNEAFAAVFGPITRTARDTEAFMKFIIGTEAWKIEPALIPIPWRHTETPRKLVIGVFADDGICRPHPPVTWAINKLSNVIDGKNGIKFRQFKPYEHLRGYDIIRQIYFPDGGEHHRAEIAASGEPMMDLSAWVMKDSHTRRRQVEDCWSLVVQREAYRKDYLAYWNTNYSDVDVLLCPVGPGVAPKHDTARYWGYTAVYNCLDWPAIAFPTGWLVNVQDHPKDASYVPRKNEFDQYNWDLYDPNDYADAPISLQLVGKKWECERVMAALRKIEQEAKA